MPDLPWRKLTALPVRRPLRLPVAVTWRWQRLCETIGLSLSAGFVQAASRIRALRWVPRRIVRIAEARLIRHAGQNVFDRDFYLDRNPDVREVGDDPLAHYLRHGWREARAPNAGFDDGYYRVHAGLAPTTPVSALGHFLAFGKARDLAPMRAVDLLDWRKRNPEIDVARIDPYEHFLRENRGARSRQLVPETSTSLLQLDALNPVKPGAPSVDVLMPVYAGRAETLSAITHVLTANCSVPFELIVIDDCTPDGELASDLRRLADDGLITLIRQGSNQGFIAAINAGMAVHPDRDVVWLNADTQVYDDWLNRLRDAAYSGSRVATVTPLSNNATLCSYPRIDADNASDLECDWPEIARMAGRVNAGQTVEIPTAVGFCTYVRREAIDALGTLDQQTFGRGYGEENDFSRRAIAAGWVNLAAADVLVRHFGGVSFGDERSQRIEHALAVLDRRYPDYHGAVHRFLSEDPLQDARRALDLARLRSARGERNVLIVTHARGGGTAQHVTEEIARLRLQGASVFVLTQGSKGKTSARLSHINAGPMPTLDALALEAEALWQILSTLDLSEILIHHLIDFGADAAGLFHERLLSLAVPYRFVVHDYFAICPRINMVDLSGMYCGEPDVAGCRRCLVKRGSVAGRPDIVTWRESYRTLLKDAAEVIVPDRDVADRLYAHFPDLGNLRIQAHETHLNIPPLPKAVRQPGPLRVAVLGAIGPIKGVDVLFATAMRAARMPEGPEFTVIGYTHNDRAARACGIAVTGPYDNSQVDLLIEQADPDVIWIPSIWPETYCYTLSIALRSGRPVAGFAIGAIATRIRAAGRGHLIPLSDAGSPERLLQALSLAADIEQESQGALVA